MKTIEQILDDAVIPEMEYEPKYDVGKTKSKKKRQAQPTVDDVPEVVLPKTKAEVYQEAKARLTKKTSASSRREVREEKRVTAKKQTTRPLNATEQEIAATSPVDVGAELTKSEMLKYRRAALKNPVDEPKWVGGEAELVPFAWRHPLLQDIEQQSKTYRLVVQSRTRREK
ncbi:MAG: hypothetical protein J1G01_00055 [Clostridiales bacterium]|nr:hypothetical protein [Clostridiales bacterium]